MEGRGEGAKGEKRREGRLGGRGKDLNMKRDPKEGKEGNFDGGELPLPLYNKFEFIHCNNLGAVLKNLSLVYSA